ncbi:uncharacterized protein LOC130454973 isoform X2 [Monodelphis domestica]|uniref:uncharacterized protein LOC130454973 isoform X2 n=1 Tax=Monodelphis domestica TaxID=13616 RepID=UPI0024E1CB7E|nr:uncharacterized protein LOC130454973 isoform X2 [Monodelphis domestica]
MLRVESSRDAAKATWTGLGHACFWLLRESQIVKPRCCGWRPPLRGRKPLYSAALGSLPGSETPEAKPEEPLLPSVPRKELRLGESPEGRNLQGNEEFQTAEAIQISIGIFQLFLGILWFYLYLTQFADSFLTYKTLIWNAKYPLLSAFIAKITVGINIIGIIYSVYGLITLVIEFLNYDSYFLHKYWPENSGKLLSNYLFIYTVLFILVSWMVLKWNHKAVYYSPH